MKISVIWIGKTSTDYINTAIETYVNRIKHYVPFKIIEIPEVKGITDTAELRVAEGNKILKTISSNDYLVLLDDKGEQFTSMQFAKYIDNMNIRSTANTVFVIGGAFGFSREVYRRANAFLSLSKMTFSHQIIRPLFLEQIYRAMTILKNEPYHHEDSLWNEVNNGKR